MSWLPPTLLGKTNKQTTKQQATAQQEMTEVQRPVSLCYSWKD